MWLRGAGVFALACAAAFAQSVPQFTILPFAGAPPNLGDNGTATSALLNEPHGVSADRNGNLYIADTTDNLIRRVSSSVVISTVSGQVAFPWHAVPDASGNLYVADAANNRVLRIAADGTASTFVGQLNSPRDVAVDRAGNVFILDTGNNRVLKVTANGQAMPYAGTGSPGYAGDTGPAVQALLNFPYGIALDSAGDLFISDSLNQRIRVVTPDGVINTIAGTNERGFNSDGAALAAAFQYPAGLAVDSVGTLYIADTGNHRIRKIVQPLSAGAQVATIAGTGAAGFSGDNSPARNAELNSPFGVSVDSQDNILIADSENHRIRKIDGKGIITTIAGSDHASGDGGPAISARMFEPAGVVIDSTGNAYIADTNNNEVRRVSNGTISLVVAGLNSPNGLALDPSGALYIADTNAHAIRKVSGSAISVVAGIAGEYGNDGDEGAATNAHLETPNAVAFDRTGNMYIADSGNNRIRVVGTDGRIHQFAGDAQQGLPGSDGDGGLATSAHLQYPRALAIDSGGNVYIADFFNDRVRMVSASTHTISTVAGTGVRGSVGAGGPASNAQLALPTGLAFDSHGNLYIADSLNNRICMIGPGNILYQVAGGNGSGDGGDGGSAAIAQLASPRDVAVDSKGIVYFSDQDNDRVRTLVAGVVQVSAVVNAASFMGGAVAPGEMVTIYGEQLAPNAGFVPASAAALATASANTQVLFDGVAAPLTYISPTQINALVPYQVAGKASTSIVVQNQGQSSVPLSVPVAAAAPGIFANTNGAVINQDGSQNTPSNPAKVGDIVVLFATGEGQTNPSGVTGALALGANPPRPVLPVTLQIGGQTAQLAYAGEMPLGAGVLQVNAVVPAGIATGDRVPVVLTIGSQQAQSGITMSIR